MSLSAHPLLHQLRSRRDFPARTLAVVNRLCRDVVQAQGHEVRRQLPSDAEIATDLGMSVATVRSHLNQAANWIDGLEELPPRVRIYLWYVLREWELRNRVTPITRQAHLPPVRSA